MDDLRLDLRIQFLGDTIIFNDEVYRKETCDEPQMWGRYETAEFLGYRTESNGKTIVNTMNFYGKDKPWRVNFPDFGAALDRGERRPYPECDMKEWLAIPRKERKERMRKNEPYGTY